MSRAKINVFSETLSKGLRRVQKLLPGIENIMEDRPSSEIFTIFLKQRNWAQKKNSAQKKVVSQNWNFCHTFASNYISLLENGQAVSCTASEILTCQSVFL